MGWKLFPSLVTIIASLLGISSENSSENPYGWLENSEDFRTQDWLKQQQALFNQYSASSNLKPEIESSLKNLMNSDVYSIPRKSGDHYLFTKKKPSEAQDVLYIQKGLEGIPRVVFDPNNLKTCLEHFVVSPDGNYLAYGTSENGSDWITYRVLDMNSQVDTIDHVEKIKFSPIVWSTNAEGFFYSRFDSDTLHSIHYHALGTSQDEDRLIYQDLHDHSVGYTPYVSSDNRYLIIDAFNGSSGPNTMSYLDLEILDSKPVTMIPCDGANYWFICSKGTKFYFLTNSNAPFRKVVVIDISKQPYVIERDVIPEGKFLLESIVPVGNDFGVVISENVASKLVLFNDDGEVVRDIPLPSLGKVTLSRINQNSNEMRDEIFFSFTNFFKPSTIYRCSLDSTPVEFFKKPSLDVNSDDFIIQQVFYKSKDGTKVPMFIAHKKDVKVDGNNQALLTGYGAYGISNYPVFDAADMVWLERGGVLALANVRGGNEYGEEWHKGAVKENKQNSFDDFIAAAEWLVENNYTKPSRLAAIGMSSGGLLVAASVNQRPDLFGAAVVKVGLLDMLRFHLFTIGRFWIGEHGNPENPDELAYLRRYSPCHNVREGIKYPAVLVTASENDDRVVPSHSYKYLAALQNAHPDNKKMLLRLNTTAGHDTSRSAGRIDEDADILTFIYQELGSAEIIQRTLQEANEAVFSPRSIRIDTLKNCTQAIPALSQMLYDQWHPYDASLTKEKLVQSFNMRLNDDQIPITFVALKDTKLIGVISLKTQSDPEFSDFPENSLWMGSFQVIPEERNQGLGQELLKLAATVASRLGYEELYFYTSVPANVEWYVKRGAYVIEERPFRNHTATIMHMPLKDLASERR